MRIPDPERVSIVELLCSDRFCDLAPAQVYNTLLDEGVYLCSERQMYRLLAEQSLVRERRRGHLRGRRYPAPRVVASAPNQCWSWDISRLVGPVSRSWFYLYVVLDIFSRKIVAWSVDTIESEVVAEKLLETACQREGIDRWQLTIHSDRGAQMTSITVGELLESLGVTRSLSRPRTSNDNPYSEANFKTVKYRPDYPDRFESIDHARKWVEAFICWYNHVHYHSGIGYLHPDDLHAGRHHPILADRQTVLDAAYAAHPERFPNGAPKTTRPPKRAWINNPSIHTKS
jgi:putative transposase